MLMRRKAEDMDHWTYCDQGHLHWGRNGAAGMLLRHTDPQTNTTRYFLQQRGPDVQNPGTWSTPGGVIEDNETPHAAAIRESQEELGQFPLTKLQHLHTLDHGGWAYHTMVGDVSQQFYPQGGTQDYEHADSGWFTPAEVDELPLHPGFREGWDQYKPNQRPNPKSVWSKASAQLWPVGIRGGDYKGYLQWFRQRTPEELVEIERGLPQYGAGWPQSNFYRALQRAKAEQQELTPRLGASSFMHPWKPGQWGKGIVTPSGQVYKWSVGPISDGLPAHQDIVDRLPYPDALKKHIHYFAMDPRGVFRFILDDRGVPSPREIQQRVWASDPNFVMPGGSGGYNPDTGMMGVPGQDPEPYAGPDDPTEHSSALRQAAQFVPELTEQDGSTEPQEVSNPEDHWPDWGEAPPKPSGTHTDYDWALTRV